MNQRHERPRRADWARAVEVFASGGAYGSGYRVTTSTVITCSHVVAESLSGVKIRDTLQHVGRAEVVWYSNELDIALLTVDFNHSDAAFIVPLPAATVGWFPHSGEGIVRFEMFGWPRADATRDADGNWIRDPVLVDGSIKIAEVAASRTGLVRLRPDDVFPSVRDGSWWEGMSGAAVFCSDMIVAVQVEQPRAEITNYLDASSIGAPSVDSAAEQLKPLVIRLAAEGVKFRPLLEQRIVAVRHAAERQLEAVTVPPPWF